jgi:hypothetical protein
MAEAQPVGLGERVPTDRLSDVLEVFSRLEANCAPGRNPDFFPGPWVAANAALAGLHLKDAESAKFNALAALHRDAHRIEDGVDSYLGLNLGDVGHLGNFVDDVNFYQWLESPSVV